MSSAAAAAMKTSQDSSTTYFYIPGLWYGELYIQKKPTLLPGRQGIIDYNFQLRFWMHITLQSPEPRQFYCFESLVAPPIHRTMAFPDLAANNRTLEAFDAASAPLFSISDPHVHLDVFPYIDGMFNNILRPRVVRFAFDAASSSCGERMRRRQGITVFAKMELISITEADRITKDPELFSKSNGTCAVCFDEVLSYSFQSVILEPCGHAFHLACIRPWLQRRNSCPLCRSAVRTIELKYD